MRASEVGSRRDTIISETAYTPCDCIVDVKCRYLAVSVVERARKRSRRAMMGPSGSFSNHSHFISSIPICYMSGVQV